MTDLVPQLDDALARLVQESSQGTSWIESSLLGSAPLDQAGAAAAAAYVRAHPDHTSYHLLGALRLNAPASFRSLPPAVRAEVLCCALAHVTFLNDWGHLDVEGSVDGDAARALLETGPAAKPCLRELLGVRSPAPLFGSEEATLSTLYQYRRCDFAYRYLCLLAGREPRFAPDPRARDDDIESLRRDESGS